MGVRSFISFKTKRDRREYVDAAFSIIFEKFDGSCKALDRALDDLYQQKEILTNIDPEYFDSVMSRLMKLSDHLERLRKQAQDDLEYVELISEENQMGV